MTKKISKKDKLDAMLQMWTVLRHENRTLPFSTESNNYKIMVALQTELVIMLGVPTKNLNVDEGKKLDDDSGKYEPDEEAERRFILEGNKNKELLRGDVIEAPTSGEGDIEPPTPQPEEDDEYEPDKEAQKTIIEKRSRKYNKPDVEPPTPQPDEEDGYEPDEDIEDSFGEE